MSAPVTLTLSGDQRSRLKAHLFPGDGKEAVALALCARHVGADRHRLLAKQVILVPYEVCTQREVDRVSWPVEWMDDVIDQAAAGRLSIAKIHSHPGDYRRFSPLDDDSDKRLFSAIHALVEADVPHASVVMMPDGSMFGRLVGTNGEFETLERIAVVGDDIEIWHDRPVCAEAAGVAGRATSAFGKKMTAEMARLTAAVVGASGTGSIVIEQLGRLGIGKLVVVDPETIEGKNLNRVINATASDAKDRTHKVAVGARAVRAMNLGTEVEVIAGDLVSAQSVDRIASADILFGCVDSAEGRDVMGRICAAFLIPYIDIGVTIRALEDGTVDSIEGAVHYLKPGGSSLLSRQAYRMEQVAADALRRQNPELYAERVREKYIKGADEEMPAVISVNMTAAAMGVNEALARLHRTRNLDNAAYATTRINLSENEIESIAEGDACPMMGKLVGRGDMAPLLGLPELSA